jgi:hypothetical protein
VDLTARGGPGVPADARASARAQLQSIDRRLAARLVGRASLDEVTAVHFADSRARIARALQAGLEVERTN